MLPSIRKCGGYGGGAVVELTEQMKELRNAMAALAQRLGPHPQSQAVNGRLDAIEEKVRKKPSPHWDVLLRWASSIDSASSLRERSDSEIQRFGVGPWEDESPTCIDTAIKRDAPS